ncbi:MAG: S9 family peptidase [Chloroflexi bacterium]|nr:S9 family peptidase [Chloroflexota bacterium]MDA1145973.1 S9 family peptidase [Chloroflexota bacterium]
MTEVLAYGEWPSPLGAEQVASAGVRLLALTARDGDLYWVEGRPAEGGRQAIVRRSADGTVIEVTPSDFNARTRVHEYGGGEHWVAGGAVFATGFNDQRLYRIDEPGVARAITPEPAIASGERYADGELSADGRWIYCVRERHAEGAEATNEIVVLAADGFDEPRVVASGWDFVSSPRVSPDGTRLAWLSWDHPRMPWDGTELRVAPILEGGALGAAELVCGGAEESVVQPRWSPDGTLHFISDRSGWWNLYRRESDGSETALAPMEAEFAGPDWVFGLSDYGFLDDGTLVCKYGSDEGARLAALRPGGSGLEPIACPWTSISSLQVDGDRVAFLGASATEAAAVIAGPADGSDWQVLARSRTDELDASYVSVAEQITFPTTNETVAHALFYAPRHAEVSGPEAERPPLVVMSHGGPTSATSGAYNAAIQFWTTRGIAVVDVNYRGSSGYGRQYRRGLNGTWGIIDTDDCIAAASYLASRGDADGERLAIRGGSAGGYTTLCALAFHDVFQAGASYFGVADAETLATDTHKFESRYLDGLIGPYPEAAATYHERSPIHFADRIKAAVILFQGLEDEVVPPAQAEQMVAALDASGLPHSYLAFEGEQHGFRQAKNIVATLEAELSFYGQVMGFEPVGVEAVSIKNLDR